MTVERKIRATGRPWTVGDVAMVADGQWGVGAQAGRCLDDETTLDHRAGGGIRVEMTLEELPRVVGIRIEDAHQREDSV